MVMLACTKVLRPGLPRIGQIGKMVLPRTVDTLFVIASFVGAVATIPVAAVLVTVLDISGPAVVVVFTVGAGFGCIVVQWKPWRGESAARVALTRAAATRNTLRTPCPGEGSALAVEPDTGSEHCPVCRRVYPKERSALVPPHYRKRRIYIGAAPVTAPTLGAVQVTQGWREVAPRR